MAESLWTDASSSLVHLLKPGGNIWMFPKIVVWPKSSILIGYSFINHPFWGTPILGNIHIKSWPMATCCQRCCCCGWDIDLMPLKVEAAQRVRDLLTSSCAATGWWLRFPTHLKNMRTSKWVHLPESSGWKSKKYVKPPPVRWSFHCLFFSIFVG